MGGAVHPHGCFCVGQVRCRSAAPPCRKLPCHPAAHCWVLSIPSHLLTPLSACQPKHRYQGKLVADVEASLGPEAAAALLGSPAALEALAAIDQLCSEWLPEGDMHVSATQLQGRRLFCVHDDDICQLPEVRGAPADRGVGAGPLRSACPALILHPIQLAH